MTGEEPDTEALDPDWYRAEYPDVERSGLSAQEHYRRFGRRLGRRPNRHAPPVPRQSWPAAAQPAFSGSAGPLPSPIMDRPAGLERAGLERIARAAVRPVLGPERTAALACYTRLVGHPGPQAPLSAALDTALAGFRLSEAALPATGLLRVRFETTGPVPNPVDNPVWLQGWQADAATPRQLLPLGNALPLTTGPVFLDLPLVHALMPVLLVVGRETGSRDSFLLPFPSLLAGGLHAAEIAAAPSAPGARFASVLAVSRRYLAAVSDWAGERALGAVAVDLTEATGMEPIFEPGVADWMSSLFGIVPEPAAQGDALSPDTTGETTGLLPVPSAPLHQSPHQSRRGTARLTLPADGLPTIAALCAPPADSTAPRLSYLVAEEGSARPLWRVSLPHTTPAQAGIPRVGPGAIAETTPLALLFRPRVMPGQARLLFPRLPDPAPALLTEPIDLVIETRDPRTLARSLRLLRKLGPHRVLVRTPDDPAPFEAVLDRELGPGAGHVLRAQEDLGTVARGGTTRLLLTLGDGIILHDSRTLPLLARLLAGAPDMVASVGCPVLAPPAEGSDIMLPVPTGLLTLTEERTLGDPGAFEALGNVTYPVAANAGVFTLWRRDWLARLDAASDEVGDVADPRRAALALGRAGGGHWCVGGLRVCHAPPLLPPEAPVPFPAAKAGAEARADDWAALRARTTLIEAL